MIGAVVRRDPQQEIGLLPQQLRGQVPPLRLEVHLLGIAGERHRRQRQIGERHRGSGAAFRGPRGDEHAVVQMHRLQIGQYRVGEKPCEKRVFLLHHAAVIRRLIAEDLIPVVPDAGVGVLEELGRRPQPRGIVPQAAGRVLHPEVELAHRHVRHIDEGRPDLVRQITETVGWPVGAGVDAGERRAGGVAEEGRLGEHHRRHGVERQHRSAEPVLGVVAEEHLAREVLVRMVAPQEEFGP